MRDLHGHAVEVKAMVESRPQLVLDLRCPGLLIGNAVVRSVGPDSARTMSPHGDPRPSSRHHEIGGEKRFLLPNARKSPSTQGCSNPPGQPSTPAASTRGGAPQRLKCRASGAPTQRSADSCANPSIFPPRDLGHRLRPRSTPLQTHPSSPQPDSPASPTPWPHPPRSPCTHAYAPQPPSNPTPQAEPPPPRHAPPPSRR